MLNNWNTRMIQGLYPFHEISADILRDSWKKSATACQYRSRCPLDEGFNSDSTRQTRKRYSEKWIITERYSGACFLDFIMRLVSTFSWIYNEQYTLRKFKKKRNFNFKNFDKLQMFKILNDFWCTCVVVVFCFYRVYSII